MRRLFDPKCGGRPQDRYIFFSIPIELEKEMVPVTYGRNKGLVGQMKIRELGLAPRAGVVVDDVLAESKR